MREDGHLSVILREVKSFTFWRDTGAELLATAMLTAVQCALPLQFVDSNEDLDLGILLKVALGMGFIVTCMIEVFGDMGGAHMNPAVSISFAAAYKITALRGVMYVAAQCIGAVGGAGLVFGLTPEVYRGSLAVTTVNEKLAVWKGMFVEMWLTAILVLTVWGATNRKRRETFMPSLPIGLALALSIMAGGNHTGASLNPARSFGPAVVMGIWEHHWVYWVGPITGGLIASFLYLTIFNRADKYNFTSGDHADEERYSRFVDAVKDLVAAENNLRRTRNDSDSGQYELDDDSYKHSEDTENHIAVIMEKSTHL